MAKNYSRIDLESMNLIDLMSVAESVNVNTEKEFKQQLINSIIDAQNVNKIETNCEHRYLIADIITNKKLNYECQ